MNSDWLRAELAAQGIEPETDDTFGVTHRCSAWLVDGTHLPCVLIRHLGQHVDRLQQSIERESNRDGSYRYCLNPVREMLKSNAQCGSFVSAFAIRRIAPSPFATPMQLQRQVGGETAMSFTAFVFETSDGRSFSYSISHHSELIFLDLPDGISFADMARVHNDAAVSGRGNILKIGPGSKGRKGTKWAPAYRARPYFECFLDDEPPLSVDMNLLEEGMT